MVRLRLKERRQRSLRSVGRFEDNKLIMHADMPAQAWLVVDS
jgi:hypothetical protein